jgi:hypothetical protein
MKRLFEAVRIYRAIRYKFMKCWRVAGNECDLQVVKIIWGLK